MSTTGPVAVEAGELSARVAEARRRFDGLCSLHRASIDRSAALHDDTVRLRDLARRRRAERVAICGRQGRFTVVGRLGKQRVAAYWSDGALVADQDLLDWANVLVAMDERWTRPGDTTPIRATLSGSRIAVLLTLLRAMTVVESVELSNEDTTNWIPRRG
jgi:hypothetical protein